MKKLNKLTELRKEKGLSQKELGEMLNVSQKTISAWENGTREPDLKSIFELCKILNTSMDILTDNPAYLNLSDEEKKKFNEQKEILETFIKLIDLLKPEDIERYMNMSKLMFPQHAEILNSSDPEGIKKFMNLDTDKISNSDKKE